MSGYERPVYDESAPIVERRLTRYGPDILNGVTTFAIEKDLFTREELRRYLSSRNLPYATRTAQLLDHLLPFIAAGMNREGIITDYEHQDDFYALFIKDTDDFALNYAIVNPPRPMDYDRIRRRMDVAEIAVKRLVWRTAAQGIDFDTFLDWMCERGLRQPECLSVIADLHNLRFLNVDSTGPLGLHAQLADEKIRDAYANLNNLHDVRECIAMIS